MIQFFKSRTLGPLLTWQVVLTGLPLMQSWDGGVTVHGKLRFSLQSLTSSGIADNLQQAFVFGLYC